MRALLVKIARRLGIEPASAVNGRCRKRSRSFGFEPLEDRQVCSVTPLIAALAQSADVEAALAETTNATAGNGFVTALYQDVLKRAPDTAGLQFYTNLLNNGATPLSIATLFWVSGEHRALQVDFFYQTLLLRPADADGRNNWVSAMRAGMTETAVVTFFVTSPEYLGLHQPNTPYVTALYNDVLGRAADTAGLNTWVDRLNNQTATVATVAQAFVGSRELHLNIVNTYYTMFLARPADASGLATWTQMLDQSPANEDVVAEAFLSSTEYINLHPTL